MKKFVALCMISVFALSTQAFANGHSAANTEKANANASKVPSGLVNSAGKTDGNSLTNATTKPGQAKKDVVED